MQSFKPMLIRPACLVQVGVVRRFNNVLVDADKQTQIEMFLGLKHLSNLPNVYYKDEGAVPLDYPDSDEELVRMLVENWGPGQDRRGMSGAEMCGGSGNAGRKGCLSTKAAV